MDSVTITESAQKYLSDLLAKQEDKTTGIRMFVSDPGTPRAETCIAYCKPGDSKEDDLVVAYDMFSVWFEHRSLPFLEDAIVDFSEDKFGGQLTIKAPNSRLPNINEDSPIEDHINYVLHNEVNPGLASHGGNITLEEVVDGYAILRFGGGCQGCGMADVTLKQGVETTLMNQVPGLKGVKDVTDHTDRSQAYFS
ncbi:MAG: Fe-S biogenesis protein NfuA [Porticoccaceae bacterium]|nr:Fe-S biogenesis protein NfuA [Pseudomonadales bacterium]MCP5171782.1 Fe-S biogenesis protein NfuA [Pseudomonadales bacterium]